MTQDGRESLGCRMSQIATNVRFQWGLDSTLGKLDPNKTVTILGKVVPAIPTNVPRFRQLVLGEVRKLPWSTYRNRLPPIHLYRSAHHYETLTSDVGWGCTIRVCQMLLLETLSRHLKVPFDENPFLLANFICERGSNGVFSLHRFLDVGERALGIRPGEWFSPAGISQVLRYLLAENSLIEGLHVYVATDNIIWKREILADMTGLSIEDFECRCSESPSTCPLCSGFMWQGAVLVLVPLMPGQKKVQSRYFQALRFFLGLRESVGIIGAKPKFALYFVGFQEDSLLYLDPHFVQKCPKDDDNLQKHLSSYHSPTVHSMPMADAGSSMSLGFYFESNEAFVDFAAKVKENAPVHEGLVSVSTTLRSPIASEDIEFVD